MPWKTARIPKIGIYSITNPIGEMYIGRSTYIQRRWGEHKRATLDVFPKLFASFQKYGIDNHFFEIVEECPIDWLVSKEAFYQGFYDTFNSGLNSKPQSKKLKPTG